MTKRFDSRKNLDAYGPKEVALLKKLWSDGLSASLVAAELNKKFGFERSRNAIIGKAHRLGLKGRESPIQRGQRRGSDRYRRREKRKVAEKALAVKPIFDEPEFGGDSKSSQEIKSESLHSSKDCQFINGEVPRYPAEPDWCPKKAEEGQPYCLEHWKLTSTRLDPGRKKGGVFVDNPKYRRRVPLAG